MDDNKPNGPPPSKPTTPTSADDRPARRESQTKPGVPNGPQPPADAKDEPNAGDPNAHPTVEELALSYQRAALAQMSYEQLLPALISEHLKAPMLDGIDPKTMSLEQAEAGFAILIPGSAHLRPGDEFRLIWGGLEYPPQLVDEINSRRSIMGRQWLFSSPQFHLQRGNVKVCYDVHRDEVRIGTSQTLHVSLQDHYSVNDKQKRRGNTFKRKKRPPKKGD